MYFFLSCGGHLETILVVILDIGITWKEGNYRLMVNIDSMTWELYIDTKNQYLIHVRAWDSVSYIFILKKNVSYVEVQDGHHLVGEQIVKIPFVFNDV